MPSVATFLAIMFAASLLFLALASVPRAWLVHGPNVLWQVDRMRAGFAAAGVALLLGIGTAYLMTQLP